jgi:hypothetical protein
MEFRGGEPTPQERADVRAILADYFAQQGTVLVEDTDAADYLVHAVLERRDPANPSEWTVVETYSANSLRSAGSDEFRWPGGMVEDDYYEPTTYSYVGFGLFYPVFFDLWSSPWHRGHVVLYPAPHRHRDWDNDRGRAEHRWHRPARWVPEKHPEWKNNPRRNDNRRTPNNDRRPDNNRRDGKDRSDGNRPGGDRHEVTAPGRPPAGNTPGHNPPAGGVQRPDQKPAPGTAPRPPVGGDHRPEQVRPPQPDRAHPGPSPKPPVVTPPSRSQPHPEAPAPEARSDQPRHGSAVVTGHGTVVTRPPQPPAPPSNHPPAPQVKPADRRPSTPNRMEPGNPEHRRPAVTPSPAPEQRVERPHPEPRHVPEVKPVAPVNPKESGNDRHPPANDKDKDKTDSDKDHPKP